MKIRRRDFLKTVGVLGVGAMTFNPVLNAFGKGSKKLGARAGAWIATTCQGCTTWCPIEVWVQDGRVVKVRGNQNSMVNPGTVCPRGHMIPKQAYDPDRLKVPMKRTNPIKGKYVDPQFVPITWAEALGTIATKIMELRAADETHKYLLMRGRYTYSRDLIYGAMTKIIGSPNGISHSAICAESENAASDYTEGAWGYRDYDLRNTKYLVLWGVDPFRSNRGVAFAMDAWPEIKANGAKVVSIDPMLTTAGAKADKWLSVIPGEDGALASAIAHHILVNGLWYKNFVGDFNGTGVSAFVADTVVTESDFTETESKGLIKWWNIELKDKTPAWAAPICGIAQADIETLAEEMAAQAPNVIVWYGPGPTMSPRGFYAGMGINALNGLLGSIDNVGGSHKRVSVSSMVNSYVSPTPYEDAIALNGLSQSKIDQRGTEFFPAIHGSVGSAVITNNVANAMLASDPYEIKVAIGYRNNWTFACTGSQRWIDAMTALPFFAHLTTHASEMTQFADIVLPCKMNGVETWSYLKTAGNLYGEAPLQQPLITPLFDVKCDENEIPFMIGKELNDNHGFSNLYDYYTTEYPDPETAATPTNEEEFAEYATKYFLKPAYDTMTNGWDDMKSLGVYTKGPATYQARWGGNFGTDSGYFEFYSERLKTQLEAHAANHSKTVDEVLSSCNYEAQGELAFVPHYESPKRWGDVAEYPYTFIDSKSRFNREGRSQNLPWYLQFKKLDPGDNNWGDCIKINPADAGVLGIVDGDAVLVTSPVGTLTTKAKLWEGIRPGTVAKTYGQGHWAYGRFASDYANLSELPDGGNNNDILPDDYDRLTGATARNGGFTGVKIEKI